VVDVGDMRGLLLGLEGLVGVVWGGIDSAVDCSWGGHGVAGGAAAVMLVVVVVVAGSLAGAGMWTGVRKGGGGGAGDGCGGGGCRVGGS